MKLEEDTEGSVCVTCAMSQSLGSRLGCKGSSHHTVLVNVL